MVFLLMLQYSTWVWSNFYYHNRTLLRRSNVHIVKNWTAWMAIYHPIATAPFKHKNVLYNCNNREHIAMPSTTRSFSAALSKNFGIFSYTNSQTHKLRIAYFPSCDSWQKLRFVFHTDGSTESKDQWFESAHHKSIILTALAQILSLRSHSSRMKQSGVWWYSHWSRQKQIQWTLDTCKSNSTPSQDVTFLSYTAAVSDANLQNSAPSSMSHACFFFQIFTKSMFVYCAAVLGHVFTAARPLCWHLPFSLEPDFNSARTRGSFWRQGKISGFREYKTVV